MWQLGTAAEAAGFLVYLAIALAILRPLVRERHLRSNPLATATATVFLALSGRYATLAVDLLGPSFGVAVHRGEAMRASIGWGMVLWDLLIAAIGIYYWTLRRSYPPLLMGATLFEDMKQRQRRAIEANDDIVQGLYFAETALYLDKPEVSEEALRTALDSARQLISDLAGEPDSPVGLGPDELVRERAALDSLVRP